MAAAGQSNQMRMVLLGITGTGKSAAGNTILGKEAFESRMSMVAVTTSCRVGWNHEVRVIDTPGFFDTTMSNDDVLQEMVKCIGMSAPGPHAFIVVVRIDRFTQEVYATMKLIKEKFGQNVKRYIIIVFVRKDELDAEGITINDHLKNFPETASGVLYECENKYIAFNNKASESEKKKQSKDLVDLVRSLDRQNGGKCYSNEMYEEAESAMVEEQRRREQKIEEDRNREFEKIKTNFHEEKKSKDDEYQQRFADIEKIVIAPNKSNDENKKRIGELEKQMLEERKVRDVEYQKRIADLEKDVNDQKSRVRDNMAADVSKGTLELDKEVVKAVGSAFVAPAVNSTKHSCSIV